MIFLLHAALPILLSSTTIIIYSYQMDVMMGFDIMAHFSPLTSWDAFIVYTFQTSSFVMPLILHKSYKKIEKTLAEFSQLYIQSMHGIISKGNHCLHLIDFPVKIIYIMAFRRH